MYARRNKEPPKRSGAPVDDQSNIDVLKMNIVHELSEEELEKLYMWVDDIPLSRPKRNITRDFSDGVLVAEILKFKMKQGLVDLHNYPACNNIKGKEANWKLLNRLVELHNYTPASNNRQKADNWFQINRKVLCRMNTEISSDVIDAICQCRPHVIESILSVLRDKIDMYLVGHIQRPTRRRDVSSDMRPEADQVDVGRGYIPSAEDFYQDGQFQSPTTRRLYPEYAAGDASYQSPGKQRHTPQTITTSNHSNGEVLPRTLLDEREVAIENREQTIMMLQAKIQRLEQLLTLKDMRIEDLATKLDHLQNPMGQQVLPSRGGMSSNRLVNKVRVGQPPTRHQVASGRY